MNTKHISGRSCIASNSAEVKRDVRPEAAEKDSLSELREGIKRLAESARTIRLPEFEMPEIQRQVYRPKHRRKRISIGIVKSILSRTVTAVSGIVLMLSAAAVIFSAYFTPCYEFVVEGAHIGYSVEKSAYQDALSEVNEIIIESFGEGEAINKTAESDIKIIRRESLSRDDDIKDSIAALSSLMVEAEVMYADGSELVGFKNADEMQSAIEEYIKSISSENSKVTVLSEITSEKRYIPAVKLADKADINSILGGENGIRVQTVTNMTYTEEIPYTTENLTDDTAYIGENTVVTAGINGIKTIIAEVTAENGVEVSRNIISDTVTSAPVTEVIRTGTKRIPTGVGSGTFLFPTTGTISSRFGTRWNKQHKGLDIANNKGTEIMAADEGVVTYSGVMNGYGNIIILDHKNGYKTYYAHCDKLFAAKGKIVEKGEVIAAMGSTGNSTGPHLHFEVREDDTPLNPENFVKK